MKVKKNILVTGGNGFIGKAFCSKYFNNTDEFNVLFFETKKYGSIHTPNCLNSFKGKDIDHVFHLAGKTFVPDSWKVPHEFVQINTNGTLNVLEFCKEEGASMTFISAYLYGNPTGLPIAENMDLDPNNPYALSKSLAEDICQFYAVNNGVKVCVLRLFNVIGETQPDHFLIPIIINQLISPEYPVVHLKGLKPKRDYVYIEDVIDAIYLSMDYVQNNSATVNTFNIASGTSVSVLEVFETIRDLLASDKKVSSEDIVRKNEILDTRADISNAVNFLKWAPKYSFKDGIKRILQSKNLI